MCKKSSFLFCRHVEVDHSSFVTLFSATLFCVKVIVSWNSCFDLAILTNFKSLSKGLV